MLIKNIVLAEVNKEEYKSKMYFSPGLREIILESLGLEYIGAQIRNKYNVKIIQQENKSNEEMLKEILKERPNVVGFTTYTFTAPNTQKICKKIKEYNQKIITVVGGYHPSGYPQIVKDKNIDFAVIGEGEVTFKELVKTLERGGDISGIKGIAYWEGGLKITEPRERIKNLDDLLFPLREKEIIKKTKIVDILYSRGCSFKCAFCDSHKIWGNRVVWRSAKNLIKEIKEIQKIHNRNDFWFTDLNFNINKDKVYEFCDEIRKEKLNIKYYTICNIQGIDKDVLRKMRESGCVQIQYGIESFSDKFLRGVGKKQQTFSEVRRILNLTNSMGINVRIFIMLGYPEDDKKSLIKLVKKIKELYRFRKEKTQQKKSMTSVIVPSTRVSFFTPFPTLPIYEEYKKRDLLLTRDFSKYTTDMPVVKCGISSRKLIEIKERILNLST